MEGSDNTPLKAREGWRTEGNQYIGQRARRALNNEYGEIVGKVDGVIIGWIPSEEDNVSESCQKRAAVWKIKYDDDASSEWCSSVCQEELQEYEVEEAIGGYKWNAWGKPVGPVQARGLCVGLLLDEEAMLRFLKEDPRARHLTIDESSTCKPRIASELLLHSDGKEAFAIRVVCMCVCVCVCVCECECECVCVCVCVWIYVATYH